MIQTEQDLSAAIFDAISNAPLQRLGCVSIDEAVERTRLRDAAPPLVLWVVGLACRRGEGLELCDHRAAEAWASSEEAHTADDTARDSSRVWLDLSAPVARDRRQGVVPSSFSAPFDGWSGQAVRVLGCLCRDGTNAKIVVQLLLRCGDGSPAGALQYLQEYEAATVLAEQGPPAYVTPPAIVERIMKEKRDIETAAQSPFLLRGVAGPSLKEIAEACIAQTGAVPDDWASFLTVEPLADPSAPVPGDATTEVPLAPLSASAIRKQNLRKLKL